MTNKFNPERPQRGCVLAKPGDKIICNNGEEFICCTKEFLMSKGYWTHRNGIIFGYSNCPENGTAGAYWNTWNQAGESNGTSFSWDIREVIPQNSEVTDDKKEEVKEEPRYSLQEIKEAWDASGWVISTSAWEVFQKNLTKISSPEYQEYLRLKAIYE